MKWLLLLPVAALFVSCAATVKPVATFQAPSLAPIEQAVMRSEQSVQGARDAARKLSDATDAKTKQDKAWQAAYNQLNDELTNAYLQLQTTKDELASKTAEIGDVVNRANIQIADVAKDRDAQKAKADSEHRSKISWVKRFWIATGVCLLSAVWIFKKPLLMLFA